jgi:branched-chain amino acid transport system substrate-binding protein
LAVLSGRWRKAYFTQSLNGKKVHAIASAFVLIPQPAMDAAAATKVPYLHGNTSLSSLELVKSNPAKYHNVFQIDSAETWYGYGFVRYLDKIVASGSWKPKNNKIHIVQEQIAYTQVISKSLQQAIAESKGTWSVGAITDISVSGAGLVAGAARAARHRCWRDLY